MRRPGRGVMARFGVVAILFFFDLILWAGRDPRARARSASSTSPRSSSAPRPSAMVLIYGSLSGVLCERSGVVNIAIEGQFIGGAFIGAMVDSIDEQLLPGGARRRGHRRPARLAPGVPRRCATSRDQIIVGVVIVTLMLSARVVPQPPGPRPPTRTSTSATSPPICRSRCSSKIPILGPMLFDENVLLLRRRSSWWLLISFGLFRTRWGLRVRSVGEHPKAAASVGINVIARTRYRNVILGGVVAGIGGVALHRLAGPVPARDHLGLRLHRARRA